MTTKSSFYIYFIILIGFFSSCNKDSDNINPRFKEITNLPPLCSVGRLGEMMIRKNGINTFISLEKDRQYDTVYDIKVVSENQIWIGNDYDVFLVVDERKVIPSNSSGDISAKSI